MRWTTLLLLPTIVLMYFACSSSETVEEKKGQAVSVEPLSLTLDQANLLATLPLACIQQEYPNKLGQVLGDRSDLGSPKELHPAFYGCFDWHSAVHGHWSMVRLLKEFPELEEAERMTKMLQENMSKENIKEEVNYFLGKHNKSYERTYGWAWLLKLAEELHTWESPIARGLEENLEPLTVLISQKMIDYLPKLQYPVRVGTHTNTAFGLAFAWDYALAAEDLELQEAIRERALAFYLDDRGCPLSWEPSGADFLSPCFEEIDLMRRILSEEEFEDWMSGFMPELAQSDFALDVAIVGDREDGQLVHLDGLNYSRAWVLYGLASQYPEVYDHLKPMAHEHLSYSFPNLVGDHYEGGHWLGSFAIYALSQQ